MVWDGRELKNNFIPTPPTIGKGTFHWARLLQTPLYKDSLLRLQVSARAHGVLQFILLYFFIIGPGTVLACINHHTPKCCSGPVLACVRDCLQDIFSCRSPGLGWWGRCAVLRWTIPFHLSLVVNHTGKQTSKRPSFIALHLHLEEEKQGLLSAGLLPLLAGSVEQISRFLPGWSRVQEAMCCCVVFQFF